MTQQVLTDRTELTTPADDDLVHIVDVSDTTDSSNGTSKKITKANLLAAIPAGLDAAKIANGSVSNTEYQYLDGVTSSIQTQITTNAEDITTNAGAISSHTGDTDNPHETDIDHVTPTTTKGDIIVEDGSNAVRLGVGTNTQVLSANSSTATGLEWVSAGTPAAHASSHENDGADEIDLTGLSVGTGTVVGTDAEQTLTTKTIDAESNTITNIGNAELNDDAGDIGGVWADWTPTWTNLTVGNGTVVAKYTQIGKTIHYRLKLTFGSTTSVSGTINVSIPVTSVFSDTAVDPTIGNILMRDDDASISYFGALRVSDTTSGIVTGFDASSSVVRNSTVNATSPFTWTTGDKLSISGTYEAA